MASQVPLCPVRRSLSQWRIELVNLDTSLPEVLNVNDVIRAEIVSKTNERVELVKNALGESTQHSSVQVQVAAGVAAHVHDHSELEWRFIGASTWAYSCSVDVKDICGPLSLEIPRVDGGDCAIYVNEKHVITTDNAQRSHTVQLPVADSDQLKIRMVVRSSIEVAAERAGRYPMTDVMAVDGPPPWGIFVNEAPYRNLVRIPACHHGWDWGPCALPIGLTGDVELWGFDKAQSMKFKPRVVDLPHAVDNDSIRVGFAEHLQIGTGTGNTSSTLPLIPALIQLCGNDENDPILFSAVVRACGTQLVKLPVHVKQDLTQWSPVIPTLYRVRILGLDTIDGSQSELSGDIICESFVGFRTVNLVRSRTLHPIPDSGALSVEESFEFEINGVPIFIRGVDVIPVDAYTSKCTDEDLASVVHWARSINCNCIRLWGGGEAPNEAMLTAADRAGIVVQVDLGFACSLYPGDQGFMKSVEEEATRWLRIIRRHPCVILVCGNNENEQWLEGEVAKATSEYRKRTLRRDYRVLTGILSRVAAREAPTTPWWPSSPSNGPDEDGSCHDERRGNVHYWSVWHGGAPFSAFDDARSRFVSEFGFQAFAAASSLKAATKTKLDSGQNTIMQYWQRSPEKGNAQIAYHIVANFRIADRILGGSRELGEDGRVKPTTDECDKLLDSSVEELAIWSQASQALALERAVTAWRGRAYDNRGIVVWQLNDLAPYHSWSLVDYFQQPKAAAYAVARAFAPRTLLLNVNGYLTALVDDVLQCELGDNETLHEFRVRVRFQVRSVDGGVLHIGDCTSSSSISRPTSIAKIANDVINLCCGLIIVDYDISIGRAVECEVKEPYNRRVSVFTKCNGSPRGAVECGLALSAKEAGLSFHDTEDGNGVFKLTTRRPCSFVTVRVSSDGNEKIKHGRFDQGSMVMLENEMRLIRFIPMNSTTIGRFPKASDLTIECVA